jgi:hypothetical protein
MFMDELVFLISNCFIRMLCALHSNTFSAVVEVAGIQGRSEAEEEDPGAGLIAPF